MREVFLNFPLGNSIVIDWTIKIWYFSSHLIYLPFNLVLTDSKPSSTNPPDQKNLKSITFNTIHIIYWVGQYLFGFFIKCYGKAQMDFVYVYMHIHIHTHIYVCMYAYTYIHICMYVYTHTNIYQVNMGYIYYQYIIITHTHIYI